MKTATNAEFALSLNLELEKMTYIVDTCRYIVFLLIDTTDTTLIAQIIVKCSQNIRK